MSTTALDHVYIGLSEVPSMENSEKISFSSSSSTTTTIITTISTGEDEKSNAFNLKETELRLGLPGSASPERKDDDDISLLGRRVDDKNAYPLGLLKNSVSGTKRGFSDAIDGSGKWVFSGSGGSRVDLSKGSVLFSPRGGNGGKPLGGLGKNSTQQSGFTVPVMNEAVSPLPELVQENKPQVTAVNDHGIAPFAKAQVVGWPPIRSFRKSTMTTNPVKNSDDAQGKSGSGCLYVKVSLDGAPYLRKIDLKTYSNYMELSSALEKMFRCFTIGQCDCHGVPERDGLHESRLVDLLHGSEYVLTYEDKDGDWMLVGDVPWGMFTDSCKEVEDHEGFRRHWNCPKGYGEMEEHESSVILEQPPTDQSTSERERRWKMRFVLHLIVVYFMD